MKSKLKKKSSTKDREIPNKYLLSSIKSAEKDIKNGKYYSFKSNEEAIKFLDKIK